MEYEYPTGVDQQHVAGNGLRRLQGDAPGGHARPEPGSGPRSWRHSVETAIPAVRGVFEHGQSRKFELSRLANQSRESSRSWAYLLEFVHFQQIAQRPTRNLLFFPHTAKQLRSQPRKRPIGLRPEISLGNEL